ncbi:hypothetical protein HZB00_01935 [Candidatus Woesearchaeota archaeon]|nr:hypothetical protein [Candidatus Woesearchaeota archaeon]
MDGIELLNDLHKKLNLPGRVLSATKILYEQAMKVVQSKHNPLALAAGSLYLFAKRYGVNVTLTQICEIAPVTREEVIEAYDSLRKMPV